ncbi:hypothetical protein L3Q82_016638, partial [Scortum barcoo]
MVVIVSQHASAVELYEGEEFVLLPCEYQTFNLDDPTVVWRRYDLNPPTVHQRLQKAALLHLHRQNITRPTESEAHTAEGQRSATNPNTTPHTVDTAAASNHKQDQFPSMPQLWSCMRGRSLSCCPVSIRLVNLDDPTVVWSRSDLNPPTVHQRHCRM